MKFSWFGIASTLLLFTQGSAVMADDTSRSLFDLTGSDAAKEWQNINDGVMGGVSEEAKKWLPNRAPCRISK